MGFGPAPRGVSVGDVAEVDTVIDAVERIVTELSRSRATLRFIGMPLAGMYVEGAIDALAFAVDAAIAGSKRLDRAPGTLSIGLIDVRMEQTGDDPYASVVGVGAVDPPTAAGPSIGASMLGEPAIAARLRADELAATLMTAALSHSDWIHLPSDAVFHGDDLAARGVVSTVVGRDTFPSWSRRRMGGMVDRTSADLLAGLGWRRMAGAALPTVG